MMCKSDQELFKIIDAKNLNDVFNAIKTKIVDALEYEYDSLDDDEMHNIDENIDYDKDIFVYISDDSYTLISSDLNFIFEKDYIDEYSEMNDDDFIELK